MKLNFKDKIVLKNLYLNSLFLAIFALSAHEEMLTLSIFSSLAYYISVMSFTKADIDNLTK